jgi:hypothetical protein
MVEHRPARGKLGQPAGPRKRRRVRLEVVLDVARHHDPLLRHPESREAVGVGAAADQDQAERLEQGRERATDPAVTRGRGVRQAAVDHRHRHSAPAGLMEQLRPQLGLDQHHQPRLRRIEHPTDRRRQVERAGQNLHRVAGRAPRQLEAARGGGGEQHRQLRPARGELAQQPPRQLDLAHRHRLHPDSAR